MSVKKYNEVNKQNNVDNMHFFDDLKLIPFYVNEEVVNLFITNYLSK